MVDSGGSNETQCVFVTTNIETRLGILLDKEDTVSAFKEKIGKEHGHSFPSVGKITVSALKVKRGDNCYHLPDSMLLRKAIQGVSNNDSFLYVDIIHVEEMVELQTRGALALSPKGAIGKDNETGEGNDFSVKKSEKTCDADQEGLVYCRHTNQTDCSSTKRKAKLKYQEKDLAPTSELAYDVNESHRDDFLSGATEKLNHSTDAENEGLIDGVNATCEAIQNATEISTKDNGEKVGEEVKSVKPKRKTSKKSDGVAEPVRRSKRPRVPNRRYTY